MHTHPPLLPPLSLHDALPILQRRFLDVLGRFRVHPSLEAESRPAELLAADPRFAPPELHRFAHVQRLRSEEHTSELQSRRDLVCRLLLEKKKPNGLG